MARLERVLYGSTATGRTDNLMNVAAILGESQRNNDRDGLTGALAAHDGRFLQVIEGPSDVLDGLLRRLDRDPRHKDIQVIERAPIETRSFADWSMAATRITPALEARLKAVVSNPADDPGRTVCLLREAVTQG